MADSAAKTEIWRRKQIAPIVTHTREAADVPPLEELLRRLLAADQDKAASTK